MGGGILSLGVLLYVIYKYCFSTNPEDGPIIDMLNDDDDADKDAANDTSAEPTQDESTANSAATPAGGWDKSATDDASQGLLERFRKFLH